VTSAEESEAEVKRLTGEIAALQRQRPNSSPGRQALAPNEIVLSIPEWAEGIVAEQADSEGKKTAEWVNEQFGAWLDTYFQQTASAR
jgi:hypothetical protein